jgi:PAS domain S-box-containing protein
MIKKDRLFTQKLIWAIVLTLFCGMIATGILTNLTLRSIEKNLPSTLLMELNELSVFVEHFSDAVNAAEKNNYLPSKNNLNSLRSKVDNVYKDIIELRQTYVFDNIVNASALHAVVAPAIADLKIWLHDGVSGFMPDSKTAAMIAFIRIRDAFQKARTMSRDSRVSAQKIMEKQKVRLDRFLFSVNLLFVLTFIVMLSMVHLLFRQNKLQRKEKDAQAELLNQRNLLNTLYENLFLGVTVWSQDGKLILSNNGFTKLTGYSVEDIKTLEDWFPKAYPDPEYRDKVMTDWQESTLQQKAIREFDVTCKDGNVKSIEFRGSFLPDGRALVTMSDVTDRKLAEKIFRQSQEIKLRSRKMESLGLLAGGVAHDLNNILSGIVSYPDLLLTDLPQDSKLRKPIETMQEAGKRAAAIVLDLLTVARGVATTKEPLNLNQSIRDYLNSPELEKLAQFYPAIKIETDLDDNLFNITGSQIHIRKIVMNLVSNAAEAIDAKGRIIISTVNKYVDRPFRGYEDFNEGEYVVLSVTDNGPGISENDKDRIFEPFYTKKIMGRSGTGLGLAVVWNTVQDHKGYIDLISNRSNTTFSLYFPVTREEILNTTLDRSIEDYKGKAEKILIVDDIDSQREIASNMLEKLGYFPISVPTGEKAVEYVKHHEVDLIILDMIMEPGINGRETYERILTFKPEQKAIITSGFAETTEVKKAQRLGAGPYIRKPFTLEQLGLAVKEELQK